MGNIFMLFLAAIQIAAAASFILKGANWFGVLTILYALSNLVLWWMQFKNVQ